MSIIKFIFAISLIPYTYLAINQGLDSDFGVYIQMYENFKFSDYQNQPLMGFIFWIGNLLNINVFIYFFFILYIPLFKLYNNLTNNLSLKISNKLFISIFSLLFLSFIQSPVMYGHLMRQSIATILFLLFMNRNYWISSVLACLIHLSILPIILINSIQSFLKINYKKKSSIIFISSFLLMIYFANSNLENIIQIDSNTGIFWVDNFFHTYSTYNDTYGNLVGLRLFLIAAFILGAKYLDHNKFIERQIYFSLISSILLSVTLSFSEVLSYRFLISAKYFAFCVIILFIAKIKFNLNLNLKINNYE
jgi:hypothetical protein